MDARAAEQRVEDRAAFDGARAAYALVDVGIDEDRFVRREKERQRVAGEVRPKREPFGPEVLDDLRTRPLPKGRLRKGMGDRNRLPFHVAGALGREIEGDGPPIGRTQAPRNVKRNGHGR
jgi:hypothetical protein